MQSIVRFFRVINAVWAMIFCFSFYYAYTAGASWFVLINPLFSAGVMLIGFVVMSKAHRSMHRFYSLLLMLLMLMQGFYLMLSLSQLSSAMSVINLLLSGLFIFYVAGFRKFIVSDKTQQHFGRHATDDAPAQ